MGLAFLVLAFSLVLTPSLVAAGDYSISVRTDKQTYHVGDKWADVFWSPDGACVKLSSGYPSSGSLEIDGPSTHTTAKIFHTDLLTGSYTPSIGNPWGAGDVGSWTVKLTVSNGYCTATGTTTLQVSA